ncbi:hypothetical protein CPC08DRAFT_760630 [Agrocybe pediades]|nr:hypothetical protein CPC08DRAFT_760630 [Agrocybe pediades]
MNPSTTSNIIAQIYQNVQYERYGHLAAGSIGLYDYFITFGEEVELIWLERWSPVKVLWLVNRYYALASLVYDYYGEILDGSGKICLELILNLDRSLSDCHFFKVVSKHIISISPIPQVRHVNTPLMPERFFSRPDCSRFPLWQGVTDIAINGLAQGILQLRVYALYPDNKRVLRLMVSSFFAAIVASSVVMWRLMSTVQRQGMEPGGQFCVVERPPARYSQAFWIPMLLFETLLFILAFVKGYQKRRPFGPFLLHRSCQRLADVLFRDSVIYFAAIGATYLTCFLIWTLFPRLSSAPLGLVSAVPCVLANRLVLNLRATARARAELMNIDGVTEEIMDESATGPIIFVMTSES